MVNMNFRLLALMRNFEEALEVDEAGQTLVEYALIIAFIVIVLIGALTFLGVNLRETYEMIANSIPYP
jgi:Flp pilus assembly pilin Flp